MGRRPWEPKHLGANLRIMSAATLALDVGAAPWRPTEIFIKVPRTHAGPGSPTVREGACKRGQDLDLALVRGRRGNVKKAVKRGFAQSAPS